jgi:uncharacterized membrane protein YqjE
MSLTLLAIISLIYLGAAVAEIAYGRYAMATVFVSYAVANLALGWMGR